MLRQFHLLLFAVLTGCVAVPTDMFPNWGELDEFERDWYTQHLAAAGEGPLPESSHETIVRLTWLRSFHNPIVVHVQCGVLCHLKSVRLSGAGGYEPGKVVESHRIRLNDAGSNEVNRLVADLLNYRGPPRDKKTYEMFGGELVEIIYTDGARWILEVVNNEVYWASSTHGAELDSILALSDLCEYLVANSGIEIPEGEYY